MAGIAAFMKKSPFFKAKNPKDQVHRNVGISAEHQVTDGPLDSDQWAIGSTWYESVLREEERKEYFARLIACLNLPQSVPIYPPRELIFNWTRFCSFEAVKVVILGQDPYLRAGQAHGLAFSVPRNIRPIPPSLRVIFKEVSRCYPTIPVPNHGCLEEWAVQGVLLLNCCLTVQEGKAGSHVSKLGWEHLTDAVIAKLCLRSKPIVFMLWGMNAWKKEQVIKPHLQQNQNILVLKAVHPLSLTSATSFVGCGHFLKANEFLWSAGMVPIDWSISSD